MDSDEGAMAGERIVTTMPSTTEGPLAASPAPTGDELDRLIAEHHRRLLRIAFVLCGSSDEAEDLVAEAYARAWPRLRAGRIDEPAAYLRRCLVHGAANRWRHEEVVRRYLRRARRARPVADGATAVEDRMVVSGCVGRLSFSQRQVIALRYLEDLSEAEVARILGVPAGNRQVPHGKSAPRPAR